MFYDNFVRKSQALGKSASAVAESMGYHRSELTRWKNSTTPRRSTLIKIADFFGCPVDELTADNSSEHKKSASPISDEALKVAKQYDDLDIYGKKADGETKDPHKIAKPPQISLFLERNCRRCKYEQGRERKSRD